MQGDPAAPPAAPQAPAEPAAAEADAKAVARILARYRERHPLAPDQLENVERTVQQALKELGAGADAPPAGPAPPRAASGDEESASVGRWRRVVLALLAAALIWLFWHRLGWVG